MNLGTMCDLAARYSDRFDEYQKTRQEDGSYAFEGEARIWFDLFKAAINEAYFDIARERMSPTKEVTLRVPKDRVIDLNAQTPQLCGVCDVLRPDRVTGVDFIFRDRDRIEVVGAREGDSIVVRYYYLPRRLQEESDEPIFPESIVDPSVYVSLAVARIWQSERKMTTAQMWSTEYYRKLRSLRTSPRPARKRRLLRTLFR